MGYSPWRQKELDMTEQLNTHTHHVLYLFKNFLKKFIVRLFQPECQLNEGRNFAVLSVAQSLAHPSLVLFSHSVMSDSLQPRGLQYIRLPCPSPSSGASSDSCPLSQRCYLTISSSASPFSFCLPSFPASQSFLMSQLSESGGQSIGVSASASVLPELYTFTLFPCSQDVSPPLT